MQKENKIILKITICTFFTLSIIFPFNVPLNIDYFSPLGKFLPYTTLISPVRTVDKVNVDSNSIYIGSDDDFLQMASQMNWDGEGTATNPFLIENLTLHGTEWQRVIDIQGTSVYFIISNCTIIGGEIGIHLLGLSNGVIVDNSISFSTDSGIRLEFIEDSRITQNNIYNCSTGIYLARSSKIELRNNVLSNNSYGIQFRNSNRNLIKQNSIFHNKYGIFIDDSWNNDIIQNNITKNLRHRQFYWWWYGGDGITLYSSYSNTIQNNSILENNNNAIQLQDSNDNYIRDNTVSVNMENGIDLSYSPENFIQGNLIENNRRGINLDRSFNNIIVDNMLTNNGLVITEGESYTYKQHDLTNNSINGKPLIFWEDVSGKIVPEAGEIILLGCQDLLITNQNISYASVGILMYSCTNVSVQNNSLSNNIDSGISSSDLRNCTISSNNITNNGYGIEIKYSVGVKILDNVIMNNQEEGIFLFEIYPNIPEPVVHNGHEYKMITIPRTWREAKTDCEALGGHLVTITSQAENDFVRSLTSWGEPTFWIGLTDEITEGEWQWVTDEVVNYTNWGSGEPNDSGGEDYVETDDSGEWNDAPSEQTRGYVCEWDEIITPKEYTTISRNIVINNSNGINLGNVQDIQISNNIINDNSLNGIEIADSSVCNIINNKVSNNEGGIKLWASKYNRIVNNTLFGHGLYIDGWESAHFSQEVVNNSVNGKPLIYWLNVSDKVISEAGQIILKFSSYISILNQNLSFASGGIDMYSCSDVTITNCTLNNNNELAIFLGNCIDCLIINNSINFNHQAIRIVNTENITITNNTIMMNQEGGVVIEEDELTIGSTIKDNIVINSSRGIDLCRLSNSSIINNRIINNSECGIRISDGDEYSITDNFVAYNGGGIELENSGYNILANNTIIGHGFSIHGWSKYDFEQRIVRNNTVNGKPFVYWNDVTDSVVSKNAGQIFLIDVQRINVTNVNIDSVASSLIVAWSNEVRIRDNCFSNNSNIAITLQNSINCDISGNYIAQNSQGIHLSESKYNNISNNLVTSNSQIGIKLQDSIFNTISKNNIFLNQEGIRLYWNSPGTWITENMIHNNSWEGIFVQGSSNTMIINNSIMNHLFSGVRIEDTESCNLSDNLIANNLGSGIRLNWGTEICIENNLIQNNSLGIEIYESSSSIISNNVIIRNKGAGILLREDGENIEISNNDICINYHTGIMIDSVRNIRIDDNSITDNCLSNLFIGGIQLQRSEFITVERNELSRNMIGISVNSSIGTIISHNSISHNSYGCYLDPESSYNSIKYNDFIENSLFLLQYNNITTSQVFDDGTENNIIFNYYTDWVIPDKENDGFVDLPYLINGSALNYDPYPITHPNPPPHCVLGNQVLYPNGGERVSGNVRIEWMEAVDSHDYPIHYIVLFSENNGAEWNSIISSTQYYSRAYYNWNTLDCYDGSLYKIKVIAFGSDNVFQEDVSDRAFSVSNGIKRPPPPPPLEIRILLLIFISSFLVILVKRGRKNSN
ncbi:MAG: NosD domain-containing protein [Promethearchaeota archaeon]